MTQVINNIDRFGWIKEAIEKQSFWNYGKDFLMIGQTRIKLNPEQYGYFKSYFEDWILRNHKEELRDKMREAWYGEDGFYPSEDEREIESSFCFNYGEEEFECDIKFTVNCLSHGFSGSYNEAPESGEFEIDYKSLEINI